MDLGNNKIRLKSQQALRGFTMLEVMLVIVVVGLMATMIVSNLVSTRPEDRLNHASDRFVAVFNLAAEYALLNNVELGLVVKDNSYQFVGFDGVYWRPLDQRDEFAAYEVKEPVILEMALDDLPIDDTQLINADLFKQEDKLFEDNFAEVDIAEKEDSTKPKKPKVNIVPQVFILSGGDITPFRLNFAYDYSVGLDTTVQVTGEYSLPLAVELINDEQI